ncbi:MAG: hypothetical protein HZC37_09725 [Burkholderiales bacterium]|nr:hypothetical protein [Burkholderiales bacterium]
MTPPPHRRILHPARRAAVAAAATAFGLLGLASCGGGDGTNPFDNAATVTNPTGTTNGQKLSFAYFQRCVMPILNAQLPVTINGVTSINSCAAGGCHDNTNGTGGALRLTGSAALIDLASAANTPDVVRTSAMYRNFYSSQGETLIGAPLASRLLNKPLVRTVLHGGGLIFADENDANARIIRYWITRPMPAGQDEFSSAAANLFTPADVNTGSCNTD